MNTLTRQNLTAVEEIVDPADLETKAGEPVMAVFLSYADGTQVEVNDRGRELIEFILSALHSGCEVNIEAAEELLTPGAAAEILGVARQSVYRWQDADLLPIVMQGRSRSVPAAAVRALKAIRDTRSLRNEANHRLHQAPSGAVPSDGALDAAEPGGALFRDIQDAVRQGNSTQAGQRWRAARAAQVAQQAQHARDVFAADRED